MRTELEIEHTQKKFDTQAKHTERLRKEYKSQLKSMKDAYDKKVAALEAKYGNYLAISQAREMMYANKLKLLEQLQKKEEEEFLKWLEELAKARQQQSDSAV